MYETGSPPRNFGPVTVPTHHMKVAAGNVRIQLLGGFGVSLNGQPVPGIVTSRLQSLTAYLALHADAAISRQQLAFLFWADSEESQARTNLRQLLHHFRSVLPEVALYLTSDHHTLCWRPAAECTIDTLEFEKAAAQRDLENAVRLYRGDLLPALYDEWLQPERERLQQVYESALDRLVSEAEDLRDLAGAIRFAELRLVRDPLREASYQTLIRLYALNGDRAGALRIYQRCADVLRRELDIEPGPATRRARDSIMQVQPAPEPERPVPAFTRARQEFPLIGREAEWAELHAAWRRAVGGQPSLVLLTGEAGIGKTRLMEELLERAALDDRASTARAPCYPSERSLAYTAAADWLRSPAIRPHVEELPAIERAQIARVLPEILLDQPEVGPPPPFTEAWQKRLFFEALARAVLRPRAVLLAIDDVQWCDPETIEWVQYLIRFDPSARLLIVATARTDGSGSASPGLDPELEIALGPLDRKSTVELAAQIAGRAVDAAAAGSLYKQTRGNPLFVVETMRAGWSANESIPAKVHAVISGRLQRLSDGAQELAAIAAVIGRPFTVELAAAVAGLPEDPVIRATDELWKNGVLEQEHTGWYDFSHGLLRDVAYGGIGPARRRQLHRRVAEAMETSSPSEADAVCGQLATHYEHAGLTDRAIHWYRYAASVVRRRFAEAEAIAHLSKALRLLESLPALPNRDRLELDLLLALGPSLAATQGYASEETGKVYTRARVLSETAGGGKLSFGVLAGSWTYHMVRAELSVAREISERYLALAHQDGDPMLLAAGHFCLGASTFQMGSSRQARPHLESSIRHEQESKRSRRSLDFGPELGVFCRSYLSHLLWLLGDTERALDESRQVVARAESISHPFSLALALAYSALLHQLRDEPESAEERAEAAAAVCRRYGFRYYLAWTPILAGWARARMGDLNAGLEGMLRGLSELRATGAALRVPYYLSLIAQACRQLGDVEGGLKRIQEAVSLGETSGEKWFQPELLRIHGDLLRHAGQETEAATCYRDALRLAGQMGTRSWELRAERSLAELQPVKARRQKG